MSDSLINVSKMRGILSLPVHIFDDNTVSLAAKGLFAQIYYSSKEIRSLKDIQKLTNDTEETINKYIDELIEAGYIMKDKKGSFSLRPKATMNSKTAVDAVDAVDDIKTSIQNTVVEPQAKKNAFDFIRDICNLSDFPDTVKKSLIDYFVKWLNGEDRFANQPLHKNMIKGRLDSLTELKNTFSLTQAEMEQCIQQSIDNHWFKFIWPLVKKSNFDRSSLVSGSYSQKEIEEIKRKAKERLEEQSDE